MFKCKTCDWLQIKVGEIFAVEEDCLMIAIKKEYGWFQILTDERDDFSTAYSNSFISSFSNQIFYKLPKSIQKLWRT